MVRSGADNSNCGLNSELVSASQDFDQAGLQPCRNSTCTLHLKDLTDLTKVLGIFSCICICGMAFSVVYSSKFTFPSLTSGYTSNLRCVYNGMPFRVSSILAPSISP